VAQLLAATSRDDRDGKSPRQESPGARCVSGSSVPRNKGCPTPCRDRLLERIARSGGSDGDGHPDPGRLIFALRQIGYSLEQALSDLVDNAINAAARNVLVRFVWTGIASCRWPSWTTDAAWETTNCATRCASGRMPGSTRPPWKVRHGTQARVLQSRTSRDRGQPERRQAPRSPWSLEGIRRNWDCEILDAAQAAALYCAPWSPLRRSANGTVVLWEGLDKLPTASTGCARHFAPSSAGWRSTWAFTSTGSWRVDGSGSCSTSRRAVNPSTRSGGDSTTQPVLLQRLAGRGFPAVVHTGRCGRRCARCGGPHLAPNSDEPEYRLGNRALAGRASTSTGTTGSSRPGVERTRAERLRATRLARAGSRRPAPEYDASFSLNVQKSSVIVPPVSWRPRRERLAGAATRWTRIARLRSRCTGAGSTRCSGAPLALGPGVPARLRKATLGGSPKRRPISGP